MRNHKQTIITVINYAWPFLVLALIVIIGWRGLAPYFSDIKGLDGVKEKLFDEETVPENLDPDEKYSITDIQAGLRPAQAGELRSRENYLASEEIPAGVIVSTSDEFVKAFSSAKPGDSIVLGAGAYELNLEIDKDINIFGQGSSTVLSAKDQEGSVVRARNANITLKNLVIADSRIGMDMKKASATVEYVKFIGLSSMALWTEESTLTLKNAYLYNSGQGIGTMNSRGSVSSCIVKNNTKSGIELGSSEFEVRENIITNNGSYGLFADPGSKVELAQNYIKDNKGFNVRLENKKEIYR